MYLIIGASSFIGRHVYDYCKRCGIGVVGTYFAHQYNAEWIKFDVCKDDLLEICKKKIGGEVPNAVILCSANANIDSCKRDTQASNKLNVLGTKRIIKQAYSLGIKCVFLSSEAVFDGKRGMYIEEDTPNPITLYGRQKLQVEQYIMHYFSDYLIFRVSRAVGSTFGEKDIFDEFFNKIIHNEEIVCLKNQSFSLTEIDDIAHVIVKALEEDVRGLYHLSSNNWISRYNLAQYYAKIMFDGYEKIVEKEYADMSFMDKRHILGGLNGEQLSGRLEFHYMNLDEILSNYKSTYKKLYFNDGKAGSNANRKLFME